MASPVSEMWTHTTVLVENDWCEKGTGFFVSRDLDDSRRKYFVATNKHVIANEPNLRREASEVHLHVNVRQDGRIVGKRVTLPLRNDNDGVRLWREHPEPDVDVFVFEVTKLINECQGLEYKAVSYENFANSTTIQKQQILPGDEVVVVGYPKGIRQGETNYPVFRQGMLATRIDEELHEDITVYGGHLEHVHTPRGFLIDGAIIKGSSGSPVVLKPVLWVGSDEIADYLEHADPYLLGIIVQTRDAPRETIAGHTESFAGLALALDADTIRETVELFF